MRSYIFTEWERERITKFLDRGTMPDGFPIIKTRMLKNLPKLTEDIKLGLEFWSAVQNEAPIELRDFARASHIWFLEHLKETSIEIPEIILDDVKRELLSKNMIFEAAIENAYCGIIIMNPDHEIIYVNKAMIEIAGTSKKQMIGIASHLVLQAKEDYIKWARRQLAAEGRFKHTMYIEEYDKWLEIEATTIMQQGKHVATIACVRNITMRKNLEQQVKELLDQLTSSTKQVVLQT
jgi:PAS domain S-box-containing protein